MTTFLRILPYLVGLGLLVAAGFAIKSWDSGRLQTAYDAGVKAERATWVAARNEAIAQASAGSQAATVVSEAAADTARADNATRSAAVASQTQATVEDIVDAHTTAKPPACRPDGAPVPLPARVLRGLDQARRSALGDS